MTARLMTPFCFASLLAAALIAEGALAPHIPADAVHAADEPATYADLYHLELLRQNVEGENPAPAAELSGL